MYPTNTAGCRSSWLPCFIEGALRPPGRASQAGIRHVYGHQSGCMLLTSVRILNTHHIGPCDSCTGHMLGLHSFSFGRWARRRQRRLQGTCRRCAVLTFRLVTTVLGLAAVPRSPSSAPSWYHHKGYKLMVSLCTRLRKGRCQM
jgi:hypothetical protein